MGEWGRVSLLQCPALTSSSRRRLGCVSMAAGVQRTGSALGPHPGASLLYGGGGDGLPRYRCPLLSRACRACFLFTYHLGVSIVSKYRHFYLSLILCMSICAMWIRKPADDTMSVSISYLDAFHGHNENPIWFLMTMMRNLIPALGSRL